MRGEGRLKAASLSQRGDGEGRVRTRCLLNPPSPPLRSPHGTFVPRGPLPARGERGRALLCRRRLVRPMVKRRGRAPASPAQGRALKGASLSQRGDGEGGPGARPEPTPHPRRSPLGTFVPRGPPSTRGGGVRAPRSRRWCFRAGEIKRRAIRACHAMATETRAGPTPYHRYER